MCTDVGSALIDIATFVRSFLSWMYLKLYVMHMISSLAYLILCYLIMQLSVNHHKHR